MDSKGKIPVVLKNNDSTLSMNRFEIYDEVAAETAGVFTLKGGEARPVEICRGQDGKGRIRIRTLDPDPSAWVEIDSLAPGDVISP